MAACGGAPGATGLADNSGVIAAVASMPLALPGPALHRHRRQALVLALAGLVIGLTPAPATGLGVKP